MRQPARSVIGYMIDLRVFFRYLREKHFIYTDIEPGQINHEQIRDFLAYMETERGNAPRARNRKLASIRN